MWGGYQSNGNSALRNFGGSGGVQAPTNLMPCIGTMNLARKSKAPQWWRTPKPGGSSSDCGQRASVLECGGPPPLSMGARARNSAGSWRAPFRFFACIGTMNLSGQSKAPQGRRTPKPGGGARDCGQRASVLECGGPPPLSMGARIRNSYGSWKAMSESSSLDFSGPASFRVTRSAMQGHETPRSTSRGWSATCPCASSEYP